MGPLDPFDLVRRLGHAPLGPLVDSLRRLHQKGTGDSRAFWDLLANREGMTDAPAREAGAPLASNSPDYESARQHFVRHAERVREQAILAEKLLDGLTRHTGVTAPESLQQELRIECAPGARSSAGFVVVNCLERAIDVYFRRGHVHGMSPDASASVRVAFTPEQPHLERGAERQIDILVDLPSRDDLPNPLEFGVDVLGDEQLLLKLWVRIELRSGGANG